MAAPSQRLARAGDALLPYDESLDENAGGVKSEATERHVTVVGKILAGVVSILGIGIFALPAGILAGGFAEEIAKRRGGGTICPHCGRRIDVIPEVQPER